MILNRIFFTVMVKFAALKLHQNCKIGIDLSFTLLLSDNSMFDNNTEIISDWSVYHSTYYASGWSVQSTPWNAGQTKSLFEGKCCAKSLYM